MCVIQLFGVTLTDRYRRDRVALAGAIPVPLAIRGELARLPPGAQEEDVAGLVRRQIAQFGALLAL